MVKIILIVF